MMIKMKQQIFIIQGYKFLINSKLTTFVWRGALWLKNLLLLSNQNALYFHDKNQYGNQNSKTDTLPPMAFLKFNSFFSLFSRSY
jgi:hypothetical protein